MFKPSILFVILIFVQSSNSICQTFAFPLDPGRVSPVTDVISFSESSILFSSYVFGTSIFTIGQSNITLLDFNEGQIWSFAYEYGFGLGANYSLITNWESENAILLSFYTETDNQNKVLTKLDYQGNVLWSKRYGPDQDINPVNLGITGTVIDERWKCHSYRRARFFFKQQWRL